MNGLHIRIGKLKQAFCFQSLSSKALQSLIFSASISLHSLYVLARFVFEAYRRGLFENIA